MAENSENESLINISSDNYSPDEKKKHLRNSKVRDPINTKNGPPSIIISDTELEEGEISEEEELKKSGPENIKDNKANEVIVEKEVVKSCATLELVSTENPVKRKLGEDLVDQTFKKGKFVDITDVTESFLWSELRVLMLGDERVVNLNWEEWAEFPEQELYYNPRGNLESVCSLAEKHLFKEYDVVFLLAFHYDFVCSNNPSKDNADDKYVLDLKTDVNIIELLKTVSKFHSKWERQYPNTYIIWTLPSPPDFLKYNSINQKDKNISPDRIDRRIQNELSKNYYTLMKNFLKEWKIRNKSIPIFPLSKVLFFKKHCYKRSFEGSGFPKFPRGFLQDGLYPTKMMSMYCAYLLVEFLLDYEFYPENKHGLDIKSAEAKLLEIDPNFKMYLHTSERSNGHSRRRSRHTSHHHHRSSRKDGSVSPRNSSHRSRSRSRSRRRRTSRQRHTKTNSRSRTRSSSKSRHRNVHSKTSRRSRTKISSSSTHSKHSHSKSGSESDFSDKSSEGSSSSSETSINVVEKPVPVDSKTVPSKEELAFFKTLRYLREVHEIQCTVYRRKPHTHPMYKDEKEKFLKRLNSKLPLEFKLPKWEMYWKQRMESIFEQTWAVKKQQLTTDLNKKVAFTSLQGYSDNESVKEILATSTPNSNDRLQFRIENAETVNSYLKDIEGSTKSLSSDLSQTPTRDVDLKNFTFADIFKDITSSNQESRVQSGEIFEKETISHKYLSQLDANKIPDMSPTLDQEGSENESYNSSDSELDVDELMENQDFLQGLDEINKELQKAVPVENKEPNSSTAIDEVIMVSTASSSLPANDTTFLCSSGNEEKVSTEEDLKAEFINVLKMLFRVSKRLGPLGLSVSALYHRSVEDLKNKGEILTSLNSDSKSLLSLVDKKLSNLLQENLPQVQKAIYGEIAERLQVLLKKINIEENVKFSKVNVHSIATATLGQQLSEVISFIKNTLLYHGYSQFTTDDVMNIYMSVKAAQLDMEKS